MAAVDDTPVCPHCGTVLLPDYRVCPFCHAPIATARSPPTAPSPPVAPSPPRACPVCRVRLVPREPLAIPQASAPPRMFEAFVCPNCRRVELYEASD